MASACHSPPQAFGCGAEGHLAKECPEPRVGEIWCVASAILALRICSNHPVPFPLLPFLFLLLSIDLNTPGRRVDYAVLVMTELQPRLNAPYPLRITERRRQQPRILS
ncbi:hypothetical protein C8R44DRAFT_887793 [Mycena epipterygia]|nr:hypothetical protein C8R44DRAFT_887793 [Mycena epipterygia]